MVNPNYQLLVDATKLLKPILGELVSVGGCATLVTDPHGRKALSAEVVKNY
jgi:hypothetical protein